MDGFYAMKKIFVVVFVLLWQSVLYAQTPSTCFEIESILVDACGTPEGENEMVIFHVGPAPLNTSNLTVAWPSNSFLGICQNAGTATTVAQLNATIQNCGWLIEPTGGILPAGARVLMITSTNVSTTANSFAGLSDTLYVIFQCAGNTGGHFANATGSGSRTLTMTFSSPAGCSDAVTYSCQSLVDINGNTGTSGTTAERDGSTVEFAWNGTPTYTNDGCNAPFQPQVIDAGIFPGTVCPGDTVPLNGTLSGAFTSYGWSGGAGTYSNSSSLTGYYVIGAGDAGTIAIVLSASNCNGTIRDTMFVQVGSAGSPVSVLPAGPVALCNGDSVQLTASGGSGPYTWNTGSSSSSIYVNTAGSYYVYAASGCGTDTAFVSVISDPAPSATIDQGTDTIICPGQQLTISVTGTGQVAWSDGSTGSTFVITGPGNYYVVSTTNCGTDTAFYTVLADTVLAQMSATPLSGQIPLSVNFTNTSSGADSYFWVFGDGQNSADTNPAHTYTAAGIYDALLIAYSSAGCTDTATIQIQVDSCVYSVNIPDVFTPNGDGINDEYFVNNQCVTSARVYIYNRWGLKIKEFEDANFHWLSETTTGSLVSEGTYFYVMYFTDFFGNEYQYKGMITVLR